MKAMYFMGVSSGTSKKGNDFYCVNVLWQNGFGNLEVKPLFVDADTFDSVKALDLPRGTAVDIKVNLGGGLEEITESKKYCRLYFDTLVSNGNGSKA